MFRLAGQATVGYGFQLVANKDAGIYDQQGTLLCMVEFEAESNEIFLKFEYNLHGLPGMAEGLCAYLLDPSVPGWDTQFDGTGPLGFGGKTGSVVGVGLDLSGSFSGGAEFANHVTVRS